MTRRRIRPLLVAAVLTVGSAACSGDDAATTDVTEPVLTVTTTTRVMDAGALDIPDIAGTYRAPVPGLGFGVAIPEDWQATLLTPDALERLSSARLADATFLDAARTVAASGAVFYAAGVDAEGRVAELKLDVQDVVGAAGAIDGIVAEVTGTGDFAESAVERLADGRVRLDFEIELASAEDGTPLRTFGSQLFVPDGDRLWSLIITSEDAATQGQLLDVFSRSFVLADAGD